MMAEDLLLILLTAKTALTYVRPTQPAYQHPGWLSGTTLAVTAHVHEFNSRLR